MIQNPSDRPNMTLHDVLRFLVRRVGGHDDGQTYDLLSMVDADEAGHKDLNSYRDEQTREREQALTDAQTPEQRAQAMQSGASAYSDADLQAELARRSGAAGSTPGTSAGVRPDALGATPAGVRVPVGVAGSGSAIAYTGPGTAAVNPRTGELEDGTDTGLDDLGAPSRPGRDASSSSSSADDLSEAELQAALDRKRARDAGAVNSSPRP